MVEPLDELMRACLPACMPDQAVVAPSFGKLPERTLEKNLEHRKLSASVLLGFKIQPMPFRNSELNTASQPACFIRMADTAQVFLPMDVCETSSGFVCRSSLFEVVTFEGPFLRFL